MNKSAYKKNSKIRHHTIGFDLPVVLLHRKSFECFAILSNSCRLMGHFVLKTIETLPSGSTMITTIVQGER